MLSRVADTLYWMSRFVERAEGVTRLVEIHRDTDLESDARSGNFGYWHSTLQSMCAKEQFEEDEMQGPDAFLLLSSHWNNSVINSINSARENARMVRDQLSEEIWVELNSLYHFLNSKKAILEYQNDESSFFDVSFAFPWSFKASPMLRFTMTRDGALCLWANISRGPTLRAGSLIL